MASHQPTLKSNSHSMNLKSDKSLYGSNQGSPLCNLPNRRNDPPLNHLKTQYQSNEFNTNLKILSAT